ncbi:MAG: [protein-PII] uridylyltransferase [Pseudomonadota bacterium]
MTDITAAFPTDDVRQQLSAFHTEMRESERDKNVLALLKSTIKDGRDAIRARLEEDGRGLACAKDLSALQDELIRVLFDFATTYVYPSRNPSSAERLAIVAVGGYGRGTLAPGSDIDLLFLRPYKQTPWGESVIEFILYRLWDLGFKVGHATRTVSECIKLSRSDMTIRTALLEARCIGGETSLFDEFWMRFERDILYNTARDFIDAKLAERDVRHKKTGESRYVVEPNVKEGKGGLRDLHTLFWIAKYFYRVRTIEELFDIGVFSRAEYRDFLKSEDFLWAVRCHMHFLTGRSEERLSFDLQAEMAARLGYRDAAGLAAVERFMKHYFLVAKDVGDLTRIFCAALELREAKKPGVIQKLMSPLGVGREPEPKPLGKDFVIDTGRLSVANERVFERDPVNLIRIFAVSHREGLLFHPDALTLIRRSLRLIDKDVRADPKANRAFIELLTDTENPERALRRMNEAGVLGKFIPDFGRIVSLVQFNMYHHYTVDEHLLRSIGALAKIERGELETELPLSHELISRIENRTVLYVALFLHDIAKGRPEDHSIAGAKVARRLCPRLGLSKADTELVAWLIEEHLTMSSIAQSRDLSDPATIADFAKVVQTPERMRLLLLLTVADIRAVGPGVWNSWKGQLLRTLYWSTLPVLTGDVPGASRDRQVASARDALQLELSHWTNAEFDAYADRHSDAYWLQTTPVQRREHVDLFQVVDAAGDRFVLQESTDAFRGVTEVTVIAPDHPTLLAEVAGACTTGDADIVSANIFTTTDGLAIDMIAVRRQLPDDEEELERARRLSALIEAGMRGEIAMPDQVKRKTRHGQPGRLKAFSIAPEVRIDNDVSTQQTLLEISGLDRPGLLYDLTTAIGTLNLNVASAHIATFGERALDVFYVTDLTGGKIQTKARQTRIKKALLKVFGETEKPRKKSTPKVAAE